MRQHLSRVLALLGLLQSRGRCKGSELTAALQLDARSLRRYIKTASELGVRISSAPGPNGGYRIVPGPKLPPILFTDDEATALLAGLALNRQLQQCPSMQAASTAMAKIERLLPPQRKVMLISTDEPRDHAEERLLSILTRTAQLRHRVRLVTKTSRGAESRFEFSPYGLLLSSGDWHVFGWCSQLDKSQLIRVDQIKTAHATVRRFEPSAKFNAVELLDTVDDSNSAGSEFRIEVRMTTTLDVARRAVRLKSGLLLHEDTGVLLCGIVDDLTVFASELAQFPFDFDVISPAELRLAMVDAGLRLLKLARSHGSPTAQGETYKNREF